MTRTPPVTAIGGGRSGLASATLAGAGRPAREAARDIAEPLG